MQGSKKQGVPLQGFQAIFTFQRIRPLYHHTQRLYLFSMAAVFHLLIRHMTPLTPSKLFSVLPLRCKVQTESHGRHTWKKNILSFLLISQFQIKIYRSNIYVTLNYLIYGCIHIALSQPNKEEHIILPSFRIILPHCTCASFKIGTTVQRIWLVGFVLQGDVWGMFAFVFVVFICVLCFYLTQV